MGLRRLATVVVVVSGSDGLRHSGAEDFKTLTLEPLAFAALLVVARLEPAEDCRRRLPSSPLPPPDGLHFLSPLFILLDPPLSLIILARDCHWRGRTATVCTGVALRHRRRTSWPAGSLLLLSLSLSALGSWLGSTTPSSCFFA